MLLFLVLILSILFTTESTNSKKSYFRIFEKHDQTSINLTNVFYFTSKLSYYVTCDQIKWLCTFTKYITQKLTTKPQYRWMSCYQLHLVHLVLKAKNLMWKNTRNIFLGHLKEWIFHILPRLQSHMEGVPQYFLEFSWIMLQYSIQALCNI